jgi:hypothetical protein
MTTLVQALCIERDHAISTGKIEPTSHDERNLHLSTPLLKLHLKR